MSRDQRNARALTLAHRLEQIIAANITAGIKRLPRNANELEVRRRALQVEEINAALAAAEHAIARLERLADEAIHYGERQ